MVEYTNPVFTDPEILLYDLENIMESDTKNAEKISEASLLVCDFLSELGYGKVSRKFREIIKQ
jgi:hypothetical protein